MKFTLTCFLLLFGLNILKSQTSISYYVDVAASVNGNGTIQNPFNKIAFAVYPVRDTTKEVIVYIKRGVYTIDPTDNFNLIYLDGSKSSATKYFTFKTYPGDEGKVIIDGSKLKTTNSYPSMFIINGGENIRIQNLVFSSLKNTIGHGIQIVNSNKIEVLNCRFDSLQWTNNSLEQGYPTVRDTSWFVSPIQVSNSSAILIENDTLSNSALGWGNFVEQVGINNTISLNGIVNINNVPVASNYYVSLVGNDTSGSGSLYKPWRTGKRAIELAGINYRSIPSTYLNIPITIYYRAGIHKPLGPGLYISEQRGQNGQWLTIRNYPGENAILDGSLLSSSFAALISVAGAKNVRIEGLKLTKVTNDSINPDTRFGIIVSGKAANIIIKNNHIYDMAWTRDPVKQKVPLSSNNLNPLVVLGTTDTAIRNVIIDSNTVYNNITGWAEAVAINGNVDSFAVTNNLVFDNANIGIVAAGNYAWVVNDTNFTVTAANNFSRNGYIRGNTSYRNISPIAVSAGIYLDGSRNILVENNLCYNNGTGISIGNEPENSVSGYHTVRSNVMRDNLSSGLYFGSSTPDSWVENCVVKDNTIKDNYMIDSVLRARSNNSAYTITNPSQRYPEVQFYRLRNSIFEQNTIESLSEKVLGFFRINHNLTLRYNTYYVITENACQATFIQDMNNDGSISSSQDSIYYTFHQYAKGTGFDQNSNCEGEYYSSTGCGITSSAKPYETGVLETSTLLNAKELAISVYPNPAINDLSIRINLKEKGIVSVQLIDLSGRLILTQQEQLSNGVQFISLKGLKQKGIAPGLYFIKVVAPNQIKTQKVTIQ